MRVAKLLTKAEWHMEPTGQGRRPRKNDRTFWWRVGSQINRPFWRPLKSPVVLVLCLFDRTFWRKVGALVFLPFVWPVPMRKPFVLLSILLLCSSLFFSLQLINSCSKSASSRGLPAALRLTPKYNPSASTNSGDTEADQIHRLNAQVDRLQSQAKEQAKQTSLALSHQSVQFSFGTYTFEIIPKSLGTGKFYTYIHLNNSGQIVYIGKGTGDRYTDTASRSQRHRYDILNSGLTSNLVLINASESAALAQEAWLINYFNWSGLHNRISGEGVPQNYLQIRWRLPNGPWTWVGR